MGLFGKKEKGVIKDTAYVPSKEESDIPIASAINFDDREQLKSFVEGSLKGVLEGAVNYFSEGMPDWPGPGSAFGRLTKSERRDVIHAFVRTKVEDAVKKLMQLEERSDEKIIMILAGYGLIFLHAILGDELPP